MANRWWGDDESCCLVCAFTHPHLCPGTPMCFYTRTHTRHTKADKDLHIHWTLGCIIDKLLITLVAISADLSREHPGSLEAEFSLEIAKVIYNPASSFSFYPQNYHNPCFQRFTAEWRRVLPSQNSNGKDGRKSDERQAMEWRRTVGTLQYIAELILNFYTPTL